MRHLSDEDIVQELEKLGQEFIPTPMQREKARQQLFQPTRQRKAFRMNSLLPSIVSLIVLLSVGIGFYVSIGESGATNVTASWEGVWLDQTSITSPTRYVFKFEKDSFTIEDRFTSFVYNPEMDKEKALRGYKIKEPSLVPGEYSNYTVKRKGDLYTITADEFTYTLKQFGPRRFAGEDGIEYSTQTYLDQIEVITDDVTPERLEIAQQNDHTFLIEWGSDSMDRGNHDFNTLEHGKLVVSTDFDELQRGQPVYYHTPSSVIAKNAAVPEMYIGRVVGLPGETVEIKGGQVYIDGKMLDTFYGKATRRGAGEEEYFNTVPSSAYRDEQGIRDYFNMDMAAVTVEENTVFILVDQWWRGYDSREYGPLPIGEIEGIITGTAE
ncbi:signal peptidase I [Sporosarcina luteola]|uniref:signal peptidase I n=1 Tax=Sporosarcina luteola TaxID=582850 RepID=UPI002042308D|nr:signal peptidase I [Sporosarcina luteola]MCM3744869.1 signal peptidase I [Sporosarcina luteola]